MKRILVLGAGEFIGMNVARAIAAEGALPIMAGGSAAAAGDAAGEHLSFALQDMASMARALRTVEGVVNCLSGSPGSITRGAAALFASAARMDNPPRIVHLSSMSVYGAVDGTIDEDAPLRGDLGAYAQAKIAAENSAAGYADKVILRAGVEFGPGGELWSGRIAQWLVSRRLGDMGAAGDGNCNLVHIDDLVSAILRSLWQPEAKGGIFNVCMNDPPTWNDYFIGYARALRAVPVARISQRQLDIETRILAAPLKVMEIAANKVGIRPFLPAPIPPSLRSLMRQEILLSSTRAQRVLAWMPGSLAQGLASAASWFHKSRQGSMISSDQPVNPRVEHE